MVPIDPRSGWAAADLPRRVAAVLALPAATLLCAAALVEELHPVVLYGWLGLGPALLYSLARVLRPEPRDVERTARHLLASAGTAFGVPALVSTGAIAIGAEVPDQFALLVVLGVPAALLAVTTLCWGALAWWVRSSRTA